MLTNLAAGTLKAKMPVEEAAGANRRGVTHLEAVGRLLSGIAPWLDVDASGSEASLQARMRDLTARGLAQGLDPASPDALNFTEGGQPLVDAAFLAQAVLRAPRTLQREHFRGLWIIAISLLVTVIGITNAMLMSVTERFRDIGTMKCLGATSRFIRRLFLLEAPFMGLVGGTLGVLLGLAFSLASYLLIYDASLVFHTFVAELPAVAFASAQALLASLVLSVVAALYPAQFAARMVPADALRTNI